MLFIYACLIVLFTRLSLTSFAYRLTFCDPRRTRLATTYNKRYKLNTKLLIFFATLQTFKILLIIHITTTTPRTRTNTKNLSLAVNPESWRLVTCTYLATRTYDLYFIVILGPRNKYCLAT